MNTNHTAAAQMLTAREYWLIDVLPKQVPAQNGGSFFDVERYYRQSAQMERLHARFLRVLLGLACYYPLAVSFDAGERWKQQIAPQELAEGLLQLPSNGSFLAVFPEQEVFVSFDGADICMSVYHPAGEFLQILQQLAAAAGLFCRRSGA